MTAATVEATVLNIDLDAVVPCQTQMEDCTRTAEWVTHLACCGRTVTVCEPHLAIGHRLWHEIESMGHGVSCGFCETCPMPHPTWRPL